MATVSFLYKTRLTPLNPVSTILVVVLLTCSIVQAEDRIRKSALAHSWYPGQPQQLAALVDNLLSDAAGAVVPPEKRIRALIVPHAGYQYSGPTAARGFRTIKGAAYQRVIVLGPAHRSRFQGLSIADVDAYETPLGRVPLDRPAVHRLRQSGLVRSIPEAHGREHSIEIELPMLQRALEPGWELVPVLVGQLEPEELRQAAELLRPLADDTTLIIVSSDFTHYGSRFGYTPFPLGPSIADDIKRLDEGALQRITSKDSEGFLDYQRRTGATICGFRPIALLLEILPPTSRIEQITYTTSGELTDDYRNSVSYVVIVVTGSNPISGGDVGMTAPSQPTMLSEPDMIQLHRFAMAGVDWAVRGMSKSSVRRLHQLVQRLSPQLETPGGAFVTLKKNGDLRGCIGLIPPRRSLYQAVFESGFRAAILDQRFSPVRPEELGDLEIGISVLTPPRPIDSYEEFRVGNQGIILKKGLHKAVFLPEVAAEQGWSREETLTQLALKAGLQPLAWKTNAAFEVFENQKYAAPFRGNGE